MGGGFLGIAGGMDAGGCALGKRVGLSIVVTAFHSSAIGSGDEMLIAALTRFFGTGGGYAFLISREVHCNFFGPIF